MRPKRRLADKSSVRKSENQRNCQLDSERLTAKIAVLSVPLPRLADFRFPRDVGALHRAGPRAFPELLAEFGSDRLLRSALEVPVWGYVDRLTPDLLEVVGADQFAPAPVHRAAEGRRSLSLIHPRGRQ
jgi:hypothetical protein